MTQKWSSRPVPKEQDAARVRENQRRHRARTKAHIADLERRLAETSAQLDEAVARNAALAREVERLRRDQAVTITTKEGEGDRGDQPPSPSTDDAPVRTEEEEEEEGGTTTDMATDGNSPPGLPEEPCVGAACPGRGLLEQPADDDACSDLPPTAPGESTIPCARALEILEGQNSDGRHDLLAFDGFLRPGYRRAAVEGGGCRVESSRVFAVMDAIQS